MEVIIVFGKPGRQVTARHHDAFSRSLTGLPVGSRLVAMNGDYSIRRAQLTLAEAENLLAAERQSLGDSPYTPPGILAVMRRPEHYTYVACLGGITVGFCSCFETPSDEGSRLEIDLLGVMPEHRGHGLAAGLIGYGVAEARQRGASRFRGVVAAQNLASQRAFQRAGLAPSPTPCTMLMYILQGNSPVSFLPAGWEWHVDKIGSVLRYTLHAPTPASPSFSRRVALAECLEVYTLSYHGLWLETIWAASSEVEQVMARAIVEHAKIQDMDEVGYLAPQAHPGTETDHAAFIREGYQNAGSYLRFTRRT